MNFDLHFGMVVLVVHVNLSLFIFEGQGHR